VTEDPRRDPQEDLTGAEYFSGRVTELPSAPVVVVPKVTDPLTMIKKGLEVVEQKFSTRAQHEFTRIHDVIGTLGAKVITDQEFEFYTSMLDLKRKGIMK
jgi:hypothetical protein